MTAPAVDAVVEVSAVVDAHVSTPDGPISAPMVAALESAWAAIRARHPEVPAVVMVLGAGSIGSAGGLRLGHFAAMRWADPDQSTDEQDGGEPGAAVRLPEVFVGGEGLARGPADVLGTLLHEAAHALAHVRGIKDTSRQGRWHNARFKTLAEELGIEVTKDDRIGWSPTTIPAATRDAYAEVVAELGRVLRLHRSAEIGGGRATKPTPPPCVCECGRRIRVSPSVLAAGPITCGVCGTDFTPRPARRPRDRRPRRLRHRRRGRAAMRTSTTTEITITIDTTALSTYSDGHLVALWHIGQANPAPHGDQAAGELTEKIGREIIRRWLRATEPELWHHQGRDYYRSQLRRVGKWNTAGEFVPTTAAPEPAVSPGADGTGV